MADWVTISSLATASGTLVLAAATFASVRSASLGRPHGRARSPGRAAAPAGALAAGGPLIKVLWVDGHHSRLEAAGRRRDQGRHPLPGRVAAERGQRHGRPAWLAPGGRAGPRRQAARRPGALPHPDPRPVRAAGRRRLLAGAFRDPARARAMPRCADPFRSTASSPWSTLRRPRGRPADGQPFRPHLRRRRHLAGLGRPPLGLDRPDPR